MSDPKPSNLATTDSIEPDTAKSRRKSPQALSIVREFALNTSTHGIPGIARSQSHHNRFFWSISLVAFTGIMMYFVTESIRVYFKYPTQTLVSVTEEDNALFPAVTVCNYSPLRYDRFIGPFLNYTNALNLTNTNDTTSFTETQAGYVRDFFQYKINRGEPLVDYFYSLESMLISCTFNSINCSKADFITFISSRYGYCYTFNAKSSKIRDGTLFNSGFNGEWGNLRLEFYVHSHQYVPYFSNSFGMVAMVHDNQEFPLLHLEGYYLDPGRHHRISYTKTAHSRAGAPYTPCGSKIPLLLQLVYARIADADFGYQQYSCFFTCTQKYVYDQCGCVDPFEWSARYFASSNGSGVIEAPLCNRTDSCLIPAKQRFADEPDVWKAYCSECAPDCDWITYLTKLSSLSAPAPWHMNRIKKHVESSGIQLPASWSSTWQSHVVGSYVGLEVTIATGRIENFTEVAAMTGIDVMSSVGGHSGLWIGISFLSIMELIEMLYRLSRYYCCQLGRIAKERQQARRLEH